MNIQTIRTKGNDGDEGLLRRIIVARRQPRLQMQLQTLNGHSAGIIALNIRTHEFDTMFQLLFVRTHLTLPFPQLATPRLSTIRRGRAVGGPRRRPTRVVIRRQNVIDPVMVQGAFEVYYTDTLNSLWNEADLTSHANAIEIAKAYYEQLIEDAANVKTC